MKLGLKPVIFEADQIGGRLRTASFAAAPEVTCDLGGMRFPSTGKAFYHYIDKLGIDTFEFPNPMAGPTPSTVIELKGRRSTPNDPTSCPHSSTRSPTPGAGRWPRTPTLNGCSRP